MAKEMKPCKGCRESVRLSEQEIAAMISQVENSGSPLASDSVYEARVAQCSNCSNLQYKTTCMVCGCVVQVRAKLLNNTCPHPQGSLWDLENN